MKNKTIVRPCTCESEFQDQRYGKGKRLMNPTMKMKLAGTQQLFRCTVCGKEHTE